MGGMKEPKGVAYVDISDEGNTSGHLGEAMANALDLKPDPGHTDLGKVNGPAVPSLREVCNVFSRVATKFEQECHTIPVLIIDNANKIAKEQLEQIQDYAKHASDNGIATVVFVSSEGRVPRHMMGSYILSYSPVNRSMLIKCCREKLVVKTWFDSRNS